MVSRKAEFIHMAISERMPEYAGFFVKKKNKTRLGHNDDDAMWSKIAISRMPIL